MADGAGFRHQAGGLAEIGVLAGALYDGFDLALLDDGTGIDGLAGFVHHGQGFSGQRGLIDLNRVALK